MSPIDITQRWLRTHASCNAYMSVQRTLLETIFAKSQTIWKRYLPCQNDHNYRFLNFGRNSCPFGLLPIKAIKVFPSFSLRTSPFCEEVDRSLYTNEPVIKTWMFIHWRTKDFCDLVHGCKQLYASYRYNTKVTPNSCILECLHSSNKETSGKYSCDISNTYICQAQLKVVGL